MFIIDIVSYTVSSVATKINIAVNFYNGFFSGRMNDIVNCAAIAGGCRVIDKISSTAFCKNNFRTIVIVINGLLVAMIANIFVMSGCNLLPGNNKNNGEEEGKINIHFYHTMGANLRAVLDKYIEKFEALHPDINVIHEQVGGYDDVRDKVSNQLLVGEQPNITYCYPDHVARYNVAKGVLTLDSFINSTEEITLANGTKEIVGLTQAQKDDFIPGYYEEGKQFGDGLMYTLPLSKSTEVLYYNKTFFDENNLNVPTTWDEMEEVCATILELNKEYNAAHPEDQQTWVPLGYDSEANWFITMCEQLDLDYTSATGKHYLFDTADHHAFVSEFRDWYTKGYLTTQEIYGAYTSGLFVSTTSERSFMSIGSSAGATHQRPTKVDGEYPFEVGIAPIPQVDGENNGKAISQGPSLCILKSGNDEEDMASWLFIKYLTTNTSFQADFSIASGYVPVIKSVENDEVYADHLASADGGDYIAALSSKVCLEMADWYFTSPAFNGSSTARDEVGALLKDCLKIDKTYSADKVKTEMEKLFDEAINECEYWAKSEE